ncbi:DUF2232 domain-containing protein [Williamsia sp. CHRR-6]|uniref:DUF2232 domain-containing protein n=1 Tax=Williamsia sp. CHRR-6 TaxID=2835871 RepID=UPI001BDA6413|nr:DUF2232 domain-containing protein [Williamsia sp. CHRR-6]MBT0567344.1 DUF2232 domain-containing protein [Williamsia sp. CHRR-6]
MTATQRDGDQQATTPPSATQPTAPAATATDAAKRRPITAIEAAEAAAFADVAAAICVLSRVLPIAGAATLVAAIPFALLGSRRRLRVCVLAGVTGWIVALLFGGYGTANMVLWSAVMGCFCGIAIRREWKVGTMIGVGVIGVAIPVAAFTTGVLAIFADYRQLVFDNIRNGLRGLARALSNGGYVSVDGFNDAVDTALRAWPITISVATLVGTLLSLLFTYLFAAPPTRSLTRRLGVPHDGRLVADTGVVAPVPLSLRDISVTHPGAAAPTIAGIDADIGVGGLVAVAGRNGAGKSTLVQIISGREPTYGFIRRAGDPGLGAPGGTAVIGQRPETSVLGLQVGDDLAWGAQNLTPGMSRALLDRVGLSVSLDAETARLSGGQLQRLAIAGAMGRNPGLLISDESTSMIDGTGRVQLMKLYRDVADHGTTVVHVTHDPRELAVADQTIVVPGGGVEIDRATRTDTGAPTATRFAVRGGRVDLRGVGFAHDSGTPWHREVLADVSMTIHPGQTVVITGPNGAGKTTLARLIAGIERPDSGTITLDGEPVRNDRTGALFGHQFARLSLVRARVRDDICDAAGVDSASGKLVHEALRELGLDPWAIAEMRVDHLSVGQQRRVALAGLLAAKPRVLVLDEPLAGLDEASRAAMVDALARVRASGTTLVIVTHDLGELATIADRAIEVTPLGPKPIPPGRRSKATLFSAVGRVLPRESPARSLWVGTKVFGLVATALMFGISPSWITVGIGAAIAAVWTAAGRIPTAALPRLPWWLVGVTLIGAVFTALGGGSPFVTILGVKLGLGGVNTWGILISITVLSFYLSLLFCWTTPMVEVPAFGQRVVGWGRRVGLRLQAVAVAVTVSLRLLPFMIGDFRALLQAVGQRRAPGKRTVQRRLEEAAAAMAIACALAAQNAREVAASMDNRGGIGVVARADRRPAARDLMVIGVMVAVVVLGIVVG